jgi:hypothetical protein
VRRLGTRPWAKKRFRTSGAAVRWLKEQALRHFPAEFAPERNQIDFDIEAILDDLYASQINGSIEWIWDGSTKSSPSLRKTKCTRRC